MNHSAVLGYVRRVDRAAFAGAMGRLGAVWLSNVGPGSLPGTELDATGMSSAHVVGHWLRS